MDQVKRELATAVRVAACLIAANLLLTAEHYPTRTFTTAQGLPSNSINGLFQDSRGFIWIATAAGIARFDGRQMQVYAPEGGDLGDYARSFLEDRSGDVWAAGIRGLIRFGGPEMTRAVHVPGPRDSRGGTGFHVLLQDPDGGFWAGSNAGLFRFRVSADGSVGTFQPVDFAPAARSRTVYALFRDRSGALWIGTHDGLYRRGPDGVPQLITHALVVGYVIEDRAGHIWATSIDKGLLRIEFKSEHPVVHSCTVSHGLPSNFIFTVVEFPGRGLLVGAHSGAAVAVPTGPTFSCAFRAPAELKLPVGDVRALLVDRHNGVWIGTEFGVIAVTTVGFMMHHVADGLIATSIQSIFESRGELFVVNNRVGLSRLEGERFRSVMPNVTGAKQFSESGWATRQCSLRDLTGDWWIATGLGLYRFSNVRRFTGLSAARARIYGKPDGLPTNAVFRIFEDSRGTLWISTIYGTEILVSLDRRRRKLVSHKVAGDLTTLPHGPATSFLEDSSGALWIGFWRGGLARLVDRRWSYFPPEAGAPADFVNDIIQTSDGRLWVGSSAGLTRIGSPRAAIPEFTTYTKRNGLSSTAVTCLTEDLSGRLYLCTGPGIDRIDPSDFPGPVRHYSSRDGLPPSTPFSAYRDSNGRLWFGTGAGLASLVPHSDEAQAANPAVLAAVRVHGADLTPLSWHGWHGMRLPAGRNDLEFQMVMPSPQGLPVLYRHRLSGVDESWSEPSQSGVVRFVGLPARQYRLEIEASASDGARSIATVASFEILPPFWRRWWFLTLAAAVIVGLIYSAHLYRLRSALEVERVRMRIATDLHDELGSDLSRLAMLSETARLDGSRNDALSRIGDLARQMLDATSDVVWAIRPERDRLKDLVERMREFAGDLFAGDGVNLSFHAPRQDARMDPEVRRHVFSIYKESLHNAARHSGASTVDVEIGVSGNHLSVRVTDNGRGFDVEGVTATPKRHGVSGMRWRAASVNAELTIESRFGAGTTVRLRATLRRKADPSRPRMSPL